jgi:hypothetical protein
MISRRRFSLGPLAWGAAAWHPSVAATLPAAESLQAELAGASIPDFYGAYLEQRLRDAQRSLP